MISSIFKFWNLKGTTRASKKLAVKIPFREPSWEFRPFYIY